MIELWSIDSCQKRVFADQYHMTVSLAQVSTYPGNVFIGFRWPADRSLKFKFFMFVEPLL